MDAREVFLNEEIRSDYRITAKMKKVWACQLEMVEMFQKVCEENGLRFWLDSGSLLGAIRHKGYIPWDDDIDLVMFRDDYDKLVQMADKVFMHPYIFQTAYTEKNFVRGHAQLRNVNTSAIIPEEIYKAFNQGIFIDIFVLDNVPDDEQEYERRKRRAYKLRDRLELRAKPIRDCSDKISRLWKAIRYHIKYPCQRSVGKLYSRYENIFREISPEGSSTVATSAWKYLSYKRDRKAYDTTEYADFEYLKLPIPGGYDHLLTLFYGDYMTPAKAPNMHGEVIFDPDTPADIKIKELRKITKGHE